MVRGFAIYVRGAKVGDGVQFHNPKSTRASCTAGVAAGHGLRQMQQVNQQKRQHGSMKSCGLFCIIKFGGSIIKVARKQNTSTMGRMCHAARSRIAI